MALSIKKKANSVVNVNLKKIIDECILGIIHNTLGIKRPFFIKGVKYFMTYTLCKQTNEKVVSSIHMMYRNKTEGRVSAKEIEISGASIVEFLDYLDINGAKEIKNSTKMYETI